jgi:hypothetical protein
VVGTDKHIQASLSGDHRHTPMAPSAIRMVGMKMKVAGDLE